MASNAEQSEDASVANRRGKWSQAAVPHRGWVCTEIEDLGEPAMFCEMCESQEIRFVHHMQHPRYGATLRVGCVCAGHLEGDATAARNRETSMKSRAGRRKRWITRAWKMSQKGNPYLLADGFRITVYARGGGWACTIAAVDEGSVRHARRNYPSVDAAKLAAFDEITRLQSAAGGTRS